MNKWIWTAFFWSLNAFAIPHVDLDANSEELQKHLRSQSRIFSTQPDERFQDILEAGKRNLDWLKELNHHRKTPISLSERGGVGGIPVEEAITYSQRSIRADFNRIKKAIPQAMADVIYSTAQLPKELTLPLEDYSKWARIVDHNYQFATRWLLMEPYLPQLGLRKRLDIRGYYFLKKVENLGAELKGFATLPVERQAELKTWILQLCFLNTSYNEKSCLTEFEKNKTQLGQMVEAFWSHGVRVYNSYFVISPFVSRENLAFVDPMHAIMNFKSDADAGINSFLKVNMEEEWQWNDFRMEILFDQPTPKITQVQWVPGAVPHVNGLGGNTIVMDANASLDDWDTQWTIRHEVGHVMGLPDCYTEFYDPEKEEIVAYQIDIEDLMCSRKGKLNARIVSELKRHYMPQP